MLAIQLELDLWNNLSAAAAQPLAANMDELWQELSNAIAPLPLQLKLQTVAEAICKIAQIHAARAQLVLDDLLDADSSDDPVLDEDMLSGMLRQTMTLDLDALLELPPVYPRSNTNSTIVAPDVNSRVILEVLDEIAAVKADEEDPMLVAHDEDILAWVSAIADYFSLVEENYACQWLS